MPERDEIEEVGPPRDDQLPPEPLGRLPGDKPAYDTAMGAEPPMAPEEPHTDKLDESETTLPQ